jgi:hypothetical protein
MVEADQGGKGKLRGCSQAAKEPGSSINEFMLFGGAIVLAVWKRGEGLSTLQLHSSYI